MEGERRSPHLHRFPKWIQDKPKTHRYYMCINRSADNDPCEQVQKYVEYIYLLISQLDNFHRFLIVNKSHHSNKPAKCFMTGPSNQPVGPEKCLDCIWMTPVSIRSCFPCPSGHTHERVGDSSQVKRKTEGSDLSWSLRTRSLGVSKMEGRRPRARCPRLHSKDLTWVLSLR